MPIKKSNLLNGTSARERKILVSLVVAILALRIFTPLLAAYLGPNRTTENTKVVAYDYRGWAIPFGQTRIGVHTGEVIVGNFGGNTIFDYRALGDPINTTARLESVNKQLGTLVCVSEATLSGQPDLPVRPVGRLVLKGKTQALMVYQPVIPEADAQAGRDLAYEAAYALMRDKQPEALQAFAALADERPDDPLVALYLRRLKAGAHGDRIVMESK